MTTTHASVPSENTSTFFALHPKTALAMMPAACQFPTSHVRKARIAVHGVNNFELIAERINKAVTRLRYFCICSLLQSFYRHKFKKPAMA